MPSIASIIATYVVLRFTQRRWLGQQLATDLPDVPLSVGGKHKGIVLTGLLLLLASAFDLQLGLPTFIAGGVTAIVVLAWKREAPWTVLKEISWGVLPLVGGLFVLVEGLEKTGVIDRLGALLHGWQDQSLTGASWAAAVCVAIASNLINNLPTGLIASAVGAAADAPRHVTGSLLMGVDIGPNLSVTGSLATILWLIALRRKARMWARSAF